MEILGYLSAILIGVSLGLIGGGGSILTVPIMVYLSGVTPVVATAYSLFVVGSSSLVGGLQKWKEGFVDIKSTIVFGIPSIVAVYAVRKYAVPAIPEELFQWGDFVFSKSLALMLLFAVLMLLASVSMLKKKKAEDSTQEPAPQVKKFNYPLILVEGLVVGAITGLVGAGGGFLIIPALVLLAGLPMKQAVGTSLMIIAIKSLIGFLGDVGGETPIDWSYLASFSALAIGGIFVGNLLSRRIHGDSLKYAFGWFVLLMGTFIIIKELAF